MNEVDKLAELICVKITDRIQQVLQVPYRYWEIYRRDLTTTPTIIRFKRRPDWTLVDTTGSSDSVRVGFGTTIDETDYFIIAANRNREFPVGFQEITCRADSGTATITVVGLRYS